MNLKTYIMKKIFLPLSILLSILSLITSCSESNGTDAKSSSADESNSTAPVYGKMIDSRDNHEYKTVVINGDTWMAENLNATHFRNGDEIPQVNSGSQWETLKTPAWCYYKTDIKNGALYGKLYNWYAVTDERGLAPEGWHVATRNEWWENLGKVDEVGYRMKDPTFWDNTKYTATPEGNNITGFTALPGGWRHYQDFYQEIGITGMWWSSNDPNYALILRLRYKNLDFTTGLDNRNGLSVRCVKDK